MKNYLIAICALFLISFTVQQVLEQGKASYYSSAFEGRRTSSGDVFRQDSLTAAHKTLPFGTRVLVKNLSNDSSVIVKINDRMSKSSPRIIDLSLKAAKKLNFVRQGITTVTIETIEILSLIHI
jgi:rare lipoprotein A